MKAAVYRAFQKNILIEEVVDPILYPDGVVVEVKANGVCRSDWHGWMGHDSDIILPHVPGHELSGIIIEVGALVKNWKRGDRITVPFCGGCGGCLQCQSGNQQICDYYFQPGFTSWGAFAELVAIRYADQNLVRLPEDMTFGDAAVLGCRFITSFRGLVAQGQLKPGQSIAIFGCGGVGLSAILIAKGMGCKVIAVDINSTQLEKAQSLGATHVLNSKNVEVEVSSIIKELTNGGVHVSVDALGHTETCVQSILSLRKRGKHIQIGLMAGDHQYPPIPMAPVIANELEIIGSHGMQAYKYPEMFEFIQKSKINLNELIGGKISLKDVPKAIMQMDQFKHFGILVMERA